MVTKEDGLRYAYLIKVDGGENNNKFYEMIENSSGYIDLFNGRVEVTRITQTPKPSSNWDKIYNSKIKKGYKDVTDLRSVKITKKKDSKYATIDNPEVADIISTLQGFAGQSVSDNYSVDSSNVTQKMVDEAQSILDSISSRVKKGADIVYLNEQLQYLFSVIPRKMKKVNDHLFVPLKDKDSISFAKEILGNEQDTLDSMAGQVIQNAPAIDQDEVDGDDKSKITLLDEFGIKMEPATDQEVEMIKKRMFDYDGRNNRGQELVRMFKVLNKQTEKIYRDTLNKAKDPKTMMMWHGSRNQNWMFILPQGLKIRPSNAVHTGSMWGDGIYGADANDILTPLKNPNPGYAKAYGYTSSSRAHWTGGSSYGKDTVYMAIMDFHVGNQKHYYNHGYDCYNINYKQLQKDGYDSVYAHGTGDGGKSGSLRNSEYIVYNSSQVSIRYLLELKS
jgi:poly [ADP-ribose] polymerase